MEGYPVISTQISSSAPEGSEEEEPLPIVLTGTRKGSLELTGKQWEGDGKGDTVRYIDSVVWDNGGGACRRDPKTCFPTY